MAVPIVIPNVGESVTTGVVSAWHHADGDFVERDDIVMDLETDKITVEVRAPAAGALKRLAKAGDQVEIGATVGEIDESAGNGRPARASKAATADGSGGVATLAPPAPPAAPTPGPAPGEDSARATPLARKAAAELGVDLSRVVGTGAGRRIREEDVVAFARQEKVSAAPPAAPPVAGPGPAPAGARPLTRERMSPLRQRIAERLVEAQHTAAMLTTFNECDMTAVMDLRKRSKEEFEKRHGVGLGFMSFFVKAAVNALRAFPAANAFLVDDGGQPALEKHGYCDIGIAVAGPKGLVVPVVRDCQSLSFAGVEAAVKDLSVRARDGKLTLEELQGGTFTITNGGIFGSLMSTPILNPPQSGILGMHAIKNRAVEDPLHPGQVAIRPMMYLALSYDHRVIDGETAVRFLVAVKQGIEDPSRLMLDL